MGNPPTDAVEDILQIYLSQSTGMNIDGLGVVQFPYLGGIPTGGNVNGKMWIEADGVHAYYAGSEAVLGAGGSGDFKADGSVPMTGDLDMATSDITADGALKIVPDATGNVTLFEDAILGDEVAGKYFEMFRNASEGNSSLRFYIDAGNTGNLLSTAGPLKLNATGVIDINTLGNGDVRFFRVSGSGENYNIRQSGYITAGTGSKYINWKVNDSTDNFELN